MTLSACSVPSEPVAVHDPFEKTNRKIHAFNKGLDRNLVKPVSNGYGIAVPDRIKNGVSNFSSNLSLPGQFVNAILQGDAEGAGRNFFRFAFNSTLGLGGFLDPATDMGLPAERADFGETLAVWGAPEGAYIELPFLGPSTQRDTAGRIVDLFTNPLSYELGDPENLAPPVSGVAARLGDRYAFGDTIDSILYESADSYAQGRLIYLESRRFDLGESGETQNEESYDALFD
ncbi:MlaA family lipoprotein [Nereida sp. MMG025]|uniref:MlaA family lipoprotein n=1 Tax=Nereida sp. MMG025 TaxID=2909981 RepID=UPI00351D4B5A|nr:VacJ family lipoprotein [Nereida sp. MMG025]